MRKNLGSVSYVTKDDSARVGIAEPSFVPSTHPTRKRYKVIYDSSTPVHTLLDSPCLNGNPGLLAGRNLGVKGVRSR